MDKKEATQYSFNGMVIVLTVVMIIMGVALAQHTDRLEFLESYMRASIENGETLNDCPICDTPVKVEQIKETFVIECSKCGLHTGYGHKSRSELVNNWNNIKNH